MIRKVDNLYRSDFTGHCFVFYVRYRILQLFKRWHQINYIRKCWTRVTIKLFQHRPSIIIPQFSLASWIYSFRVFSSGVSLFSRSSTPLHPLHREDAVPPHHSMEEIHHRHDLLENQKLFSGQVDKIAIPTALPATM